MPMTMPTPTHTQAVVNRPMVSTAVLVTGSLLLLASIAMAVSVGAADIAVAHVWKALVAYDSSQETHQIIMSIRLPREIGAAFVGAALAVSGAIMQGVTRNPLADPGLLGLHAGASLALACVLAFGAAPNYATIMLVCFLGAGIGAALVFGLGSLRRGGMTPASITLAGAAVTALFTALAEGIALFFNLSQEITFWIAGGVSGTNWLQLSVLIPVVLAGILTAIWQANNVTLLSFGEEVAKGLGQQTVRTKAILLVVVLILSGASVAIVGSIAFFGLLVPHMIRPLVGTDYRWIIPCSAVYGGMFLVLADTAARMVNPPFETPLGAVVALVGVPIFLILTRRTGRGV